MAVTAFNFGVGKLKIKDIIFGPFLNRPYGSGSSAIRDGLYMGIIV